MGFFPIKIVYLLGLVILLFSCGGGSQGGSSRSKLTVGSTQQIGAQLNSQLSAVSTDGSFSYSSDASQSVNTSNSVGNSLNSTDTDSSNSNNQGPPINIEIFNSTDVSASLNSNPYFVEGIATTQQMIYNQNASSNTATSTSTGIVSSTNTASAINSSVVQWVPFDMTQTDQTMTINLYGGYYKFNLTGNSCLNYSNNSLNLADCSDANIVIYTHENVFFLVQSISNRQCLHFLSPGTLEVVPCQETAQDQYFNIFPATPSTGTDTGLGTTYNRTSSGGAMTYCPPGQEQNIGLCFPPCDEGWYGVSGTCWQNCPPNTTESGMWCTKNVISRSMYIPGQKSTDITNPGFWEKADCNSGYSYTQGACYSDCPDGYEGVLMTCTATCGDLIDTQVSCQKKSVIRTGTMPTCQAGQEKIALMCFDQCKPGYKSGSFDVGGFFTQGQVASCTLCTTSDTDATCSTGTGTGSSTGTSTVTSSGTGTGTGH